MSSIFKTYFNWTSKYAGNTNAIWAPVAANTAKNSNIHLLFMLFSLLFISKFLCDPCLDDYGCYIQY